MTQLGSGKGYRTETACFAVVVVVVVVVVFWNKVDFWR